MQIFKSTIFFVLVSVISAYASPQSCIPENFACTYNSQCCSGLVCRNLFSDGVSDLATFLFVIIDATADTAYMLATLILAIY